MTINTTNSSLTESEFWIKLRKFIGQLEGSSPTAYYDTKGIPTIGVGIALTNLQGLATENLDKVYDELNITSNSLKNSLRLIITDKNRAARAKAAATAKDWQELASINKELSTALKNALGRDFSLTEDQITKLFKADVTDRITSIKAATGLNYSDELIAVASTKFNGVYGPKLAAAIAGGDRAEAWFQIQYEHDDELQTRRYAEAALFGLYNNGNGPANKDEAYNVYQMFTTHRDEVTNSGFTILQYDQKYASRIALAQIELDAAEIGSYQAKTMISALQPAATLLINTYGQGRSFDPLNIYVASDDKLNLVGSSGADLLIGNALNNSFSGGAGNDLIYAGNGEDILNGGTGADTLIGGAGQDTYYIDGNDTIIDNDGVGSVIIQGVTASGGKETEEGSGIYESEDKKLYYTRIGNQLAITSSSGRALVNQWSAEQLGIHLNAKQPDPEPPRIDPLVLDLDGDGIETVGVQAGVLFDHRGEGVKITTGWIHPDDGWLVLDRNNNNLIDSGKELFGVDTIKSNGQKASDGFDALKDFDSNADGKIDATDEVFSKLRIWQDENQDGISQAEELTALADNNIIAINLTATNTNINLGNGNIQTALGSFTRSDGSSGVAGETTDSAAGNLDLSVNTFYSHFSNSVSSTEQAAQLPNLRGSGQVRDLSEAISLSPELGDYVQNYLQQTTRDSQINLLDHLIALWAETSEMKSLKQQAEALADQGVTLTYNLSELAQGDAGYSEFIRKLGIVEKFMGLTFGGANGETRITELDNHSGQLTIAMNAAQINQIELIYNNFINNIYQPLLLQNRLATYAEKLQLEIVEGNIQLTYSEVEDAFKQAIAENPTQGILDLIDFINAEGGQALNSFGWRANDFLIAEFKKLNDPMLVIQALRQSHLLSMPPSVSADFLVGTTKEDVIRANAGDDILIGGVGNDTLSGGPGSDAYMFARGDGQDTINNYDWSTNKTDILKFTDIQSTEVKATRSNNNLILKINGSTDQITVADYFYEYRSGVYNYQLEQIQFADLDAQSNPVVWNVEKVKALLITPTEQADTLYGYSSNDSINGLGGDDTIYGYAGDDTLIGGAGNDSLTGGSGSDVYVFNKGDGQDVINNYDDSANNTDILKLTDIQSNEVLVVREEGDLILKIINNESATTDQIALDYNAINQVEFADLDAQGNPIIWDAAEIKRLAILGTEHNDELNGDGTAETINGLAGDDQIDASWGDDTLIGGTGNDYLSGGIGSDTYLYSRGDGKDSIYDKDRHDYLNLPPSDIEEIDTLKFTDMNSDEVHLSQRGNDLVIKVSGSATNQVTVRDYFRASDLTGRYAYQIERIEFADFNSQGQPVVWNTDKITQLAQLGNSGNDVFYADSAGDSLEGGTGNDTLISGLGNDFLSGDAGSDIYVFSKGFGLDTINNYADVVVEIPPDEEGYTYTIKTETSQDKTDRIIFSDIRSDQVKLERIGDDVKIAVLNSQDQLTLKDYFSQQRQDGQNIYPYQIERIQFADKDIYGRPIVWNRDQIIERIQTTHIGSENNDIFGGGRWFDNYDNSASDIYSGLGGNDSIEAGEGNDTLIGGLGNDYLQGDAGSDTYIFNKGDGHDAINNYGNSDERKTDTLKLVGIHASEVTLIKTSNQYLSGVGSGQHLVIQIQGTQDQLTVFNYFGNENGSTYRLNRIEFSDGSQWNTEQQVLLGYLIRGTDNADILTGDTSGHTFIGGRGNDTMSSASGADAYIFNRGDGQDIIIDEGEYQIYDEQWGESIAVPGDPDQLQFGAGITINDLKVTRSDGDLIIKIIDPNNLNTHSPDQITLAEWFNAGQNSDSHQIESFLFADGSQLTRAQLLDLGRVVVGTQGDDKLWNVADNTTFLAGRGNDTLISYQAADTYIFSKGDGQDTIGNYDWSENKTDILKFTNINSSEVTATRNYGDLIIKIANSTDQITIQNWFSWEGYRIEQFVFADGSSWDNFQFGTDTVDALTGTDKNDYLDGGAGADTLTGGKGNDVYIVDNAKDKITELSSAGTDTVQSSINYTLGNNLENLTLIGSGLINGVGNTLNNKIIGNSASNTLIGNSGDDTLDGGLGADTLIGGAGADTLIGGAGNDTYVIDNLSDKITEFSGGGTDTIISSVDISTLFAFTERLTLSGSAIKGGGNSDNNIIQGNALNNILDGKTGVDTLIGGLGNDTYLIENTGDKVTENANEGIDTAQSSISYTLVTNVENLTLTGSGLINGIGNALNNKIIGNSVSNTLIGNAGDDILDGGAGADTLIGGVGNDTYVIDNSNDKITELSGGGSDTIISSINIAALFAFTEKLTLTGTATQGGGNSDNNIIQGNGSNNILDGKAGDDTLDGGLGADSLIGGLGNDTYLFNISGGKDVIADSAGKDSLIFGTGINANQLWFKHTGNNLVLTRIGTADTMTIKDWYLQTATNNTHIETFKSGDGKVLLDTAVENLVQAMAGYALPASGQTTLPSNYQTALNAIIAGNWK